MALDNLQWILFWTWNLYDQLAGGEPGVRDGPGGPIVIGMPGTDGCPRRWSYKFHVQKRIHCRLSSAIRAAVACWRQIAR